MTEKNVQTSTEQAMYGIKPGMENFRLHKRWIAVQAHYMSYHDKSNTL